MSLLLETICADALLSKGSAVLAERRAPARLASRDLGLFSDQPEMQAAVGNRLGWLEAPAHFFEQAAALETRARVFAKGASEVVLLGMGGSSLCPELLAKLFGDLNCEGQAPGGPTLRVLDSTDPDHIAAFAASLSSDNRDTRDTRFLVASKSGGTIETLSLYRFFRARFEAKAFAAITDPGSDLEQIAAKEGFSECFLNPPDIGGRFSALSCFGLVPAAILWVDLKRLLGPARRLAQASGLGPADPLRAVAVDEAEKVRSPGAQLGALLGAAALAGRDKLYVRSSKGLPGLGAWTEQLIAESTGKAGQGILPVDCGCVGVSGEEDSASEGRIGEDGLELFFQLGEDAAAAQAAERARARGRPFACLRVEDRYDLGAIFFALELATAYAGLLLGVNPFDEPNVKEAKTRTASLLADAGRPAEAKVAKPAAPVILAAQSGPLRLFAQAGAEAGGDLAQQLSTLLEGVGERDYLALQAFLPASEAVGEALLELRSQLATRLGRPVTLGVGPRFLHSTGQLHKGGPATGVFLQLTHTPGATLAIPDAPYGFETLFEAQAAGDLAALWARGRRALRVDLGRGQPALALASLGALLRSD